MRRLIHHVGHKLPTILVTLITTALVITALVYQGIATAEVDVDDGGIWVTNQSRQLVGHMNYESRTLDSALRTQNTEFNIDQYKDTVSFVDRGAASVAPIEVGAVRLGVATSLPTQASVVQGGTRLGVLDTTEGYLWVTSAESPSDVAFGEETAVATDLKNAVLAATAEGTVFALTPQGTLVSVTPSGAVDTVETTQIEGISARAELQLTAVGSEAIAYDSTSNTLIFTDGTKRDLNKDSVRTGGKLQVSGPESDVVLLATETELVEIPLDGSAVRQHQATESNTSGIPVRPVQHQNCAYAAWGGSGAYQRICADKAANTSMVVDSLKTAKDLQFRTNRTRIVLNETRNGNIWLPDHDMVLMDDWEQIDSQLKEKENLEDSPQLTEEIADPERQENNTPPEAVDDEFGVRPGRTTTLPVLMNDSDADGDVLTARPVSQPSGAKISRTRGGRALQIADVVDENARVKFVYEASDGRALDTANVTVNVHPWSVNGAPEQLRDPGVKVGTNAQVEYNVLTDWLDPDGDPIFLKNAGGVDHLDVQFRQEGVVSVRDLGAAPGSYTLPIEVSDGRESAQGTLTVHVQSPGNLPPVVNADFYVIPVGETLVIEPLANDTDPNGDPLSLVAVSVAPTGTTVTPDLEVGAISFIGRAAGSYQFTYTITDGPSTALGVIRVDVVEADNEAQPVAEDDLAVLPAGGYVNVAPLDNDSDPSGGVLVVQRIEVPEDSGLEVILIDRHLLRISSPAGLTEAVSIPYVVSNGVHTAQALVTVVPTEARNDKLPPRLQPDRAKVRVGDIVSVSVLANDVSEGGLAMRVDPTLEFTPQPEIGTPFVTGNQVRLEAGTKPGYMHVSYTVRDSAGNLATSHVLFEVRPLEGTNAAPQPKALTAWAVAGQTSRIPVPLNGIDPDGDSVTLVGIEQSPSKGSVELGVDWLEYTPTASSTGTDVFTYIVEDRQGKQSSARVRVGIAPPDTYNQNPTAVRDTVRARPERRLAIAVLANDIDADGDTVSLVEGSLQSADPQVQPKIDGNTISVVTPAAEGSYVISYGISDGRGGTAHGSLTVNVANDAPLRAPIARDDVVTLAEVADANGHVDVKVLENDEDPDGDSKALTVSTHAPGVSVVGGQLRITPEEKRRMIVYTITDEDGLTASAIVSVPGAERTFPIINEARIPYEVRAGQEVTLDIRDFVVVRNGRTARIGEPSLVKPGAGIVPDVAIDSDRVLRFRVAEDFTGKTALSFEVRDGAPDDESALSAVLSLPLKVLAAENTPPVVTPTPLRVSAGGEPTRVDLAQMVHDPDGQNPATFSYSLGTVPDGVTAQVIGTQLSVQARVDQVKGPVGSIAIIVNDGSGDVQALIPVTVVASTRPLIQVSDAQINAAKAGGQERIDLAQYTINPFPDTPLRILSASVQQGEGTVDPQGTILNVTPAVGFHGQMTVTYRVIDATGDPDRVVEGRIKLVVRDRPEPPTNVSAQPIGPGKAIVSFQPGANNGAEITSFTITNINSGQTFECRVASCPVEGLTNGVEHSFSVVAHNDVGASGPSAPSAPVLVDMRPGRPTAPLGVAKDGAVVLTWTPPENQGSAIRSYTIFAAGGSDTVREYSVDGSATSFTVPDLQNGTAYRFSIQAKNAAPQPSDTSELSGAVIPFGSPSSPSAVLTSFSDQADGLVVANFTVTHGPDNGRAIVQYEVKVNGADVRRQPAEGTVSITLVPGESYDISIAAVDQEGQVSAPDIKQGIKPKGRPLGLREPTVQATGTSQEVRISDLSTVAGNGYDASSLTIEWAAENGAEWKPIASIISLPANGSQVIRLRQSGKGNAGEDVSGPEISVHAHPYGPPSIASLEAISKDDGVLWRWNAQIDGLGQEITGMSLNVNGTSYDINGASGERFIPGEVGVEHFATLTITSALSNPVTRDTSGYPRGVITISAPQFCTPEEFASQFPGWGYQEPCMKLKVTPEKWAPSISSLMCRYKDPLTQDERTFEAVVGQENDLPAFVVNPGSPVEVWARDNIRCDG